MTTIETPYICCDCSDCGFSRVRGPCYLEEYFSNKDNYFLNEERVRQQETIGFKVYSKMCQQITEDKKQFVSVMRISIV